MNISIPKGTKDILPSESYRWQWLEERFRQTCARYGYKEYRTPVFEHTELFQRGIGSTTDVVQKEMYTFEIAERSLTLKPEGTAGVVRSFIENKLYAGQLPAKFYYITPCYRYEKMQKGRQREFHQFGIELFGSDSMLADAEVIALAYDFLSSVGVEGFRLHINSIGCPDCRAEYRKALQDFIRPNLDKLCETSRSRFDTNPMRILDSKDPDDQKYLVGAPKITDYLCGDCRKAFAELQDALDALGIPYEVDPGIVRGLDYYTKTAFEFVSDRLGAQSTVCGGGRYDHLVEEIGGPEMPGVGFGLGIERLLLMIEACGAEIPAEPDCDVFIAAMGERAQREAAKLAARLRSSGVRVLTDTCGRGLKAQLKYADRSGASKCLVIGDDELERGAAQLRDMKQSSQEELPIEEALERILKG
ncbi:MAG: histidine--tRNA ligase [Firmicutes bacterium]|nr:histidine--tRNA ligase [Bacillota bacterium]